MKRIYPDDFEDEVKALKLPRKYATREHVADWLDEDVMVIGPHGRPSLILLKGVVASGLFSDLYQRRHLVNERLTNRGSALGATMRRGIKADGTLGKRFGVPAQPLATQPRARHGVLGYLGATPDQPRHEARLGARHPELLLVARPLAEAVDELYSEVAPEHYARQRRHAQLAPGWHLWDTSFTTAYIARNLCCAYHRDRGNLRGALTCLMPMGDFAGGELVFPRWMLGVVFGPGDLLLFDARELHGNLPFTGERLSVAFYCEANIV